jgi:glycosyl-4,4'-diaponeurosporenoate acyltransferase
MPLIQLPPGTAIMLNIGLWFLIHFSAGYISAKLPAARFSRDDGIFHTRRWENGGQIYQELLHIKTWKLRIPDAGNVFGQDARKSTFASTRPDYLKRFILETRRAEWTHWIQLLPVPLFFIFNDWRIGIFMIIYALGVNLPCIMIQRYNRPRLQKILDRKSSRD